MPLPTPRQDEEKVDFIFRWMRDDIATAEFPDVDLRWTACEKEWARMMGDNARIKSDKWLAWMQVAIVVLAAAVVFHYVAHTLAIVAKYIDWV